MCVLDLKAMREGVAVINENGVIAGHPRPALDGGYDGVIMAGACGPLNAAPEQRADDALVNKFVAHL